jgi:hypothetical protein
VDFPKETGKFNANRNDTSTPAKIKLKRVFFAVSFTQDAVIGHRENMRFAMLHRKTGSGLNLLRPGFRS